MHNTHAHRDQSDAVPSAPRCYICNPDYHGDELCHAHATDDPFQHEQASDDRQSEQQEFRDRNAETIEIWRRY